MRTLFKLVALSALLVTGAAGQVLLDRTVATVNKAVILESDLTLATAFERLNSENPQTVSDSAELKNKVLTRLIDQILVMQNLLVLPPISDEQVQKQMQTIRQHAKVANDSEWRRLLDSLGTSDDDIQEQVRRQLQIMTALDQRFRPAVRVRNMEVERYYNEEYAPAVRKAGGQPQPLPQVRGRIEQILGERQLEDLTSQWIATLRGAATINRQIEFGVKESTPRRTQKDWVSNQ